MKLPHAIPTKESEYKFKFPLIKKLILVERKKNSIQDIQKDLRSLEALIGKMEDCVSRMDQSESRQPKVRLRNLQNEVKSIKKELQRNEPMSANNFSGPSGNSFGETAIDIERKEGEQRELILESSHLLEETSASIKRAYGSVKESEKIGQETLGELGRQKEQLLKAEDHVRSFHKNFIFFLPYFSFS